MPIATNRGQEGLLGVVSGDGQPATTAWVTVGTTQITAVTGEDANLVYPHHPQDARTAGARLAETKKLKQILCAEGRPYEATSNE